MYKVKIRMNNGYCYENGEVFAFLNGNTSYTDTSCAGWKYAKLYKEGK